MSKAPTRRKPLNKAALERINAVENVEKVEPVVTAASVQIGVTQRGANEPLLTLLAHTVLTLNFFVEAAISR